MAAAQHPSRNILCVLAGGASSRFGSSKLYVHIDGEPILAWQVRRLLGGVGRAIPGKAEAWISTAPAERMALPGITSFEHHVRDGVRFEGPLTGMWAVLEQARSQDIVAFVPADMPLLEEQHLAGLARLLAQEPEAAVVMAKWLDGPRRDRVEPLPSVWRAGRGLMLRNTVGRLAGPSQLAGQEGVICAGLEHARDAAAWMSINRRDDLPKIEEVLGKPLTAERPMDCE